jgi:hypothetical protein
MRHNVGEGLGGAIKTFETVSCGQTSEEVTYKIL